jgi:uncharacterized protein (DUF427 family)
MAYYPSLKPEGNPTHTYFSFSDWSTLWNQTTNNSTELHTDPHNIKLEGYRHLHLHTTQNWKGTSTYLHTQHKTKRVQAPTFTHTTQNWKGTGTYIYTHTKQNWKGTGTYIYTDCYSILTYPILQCNLDVLIEELSTLLNYILSLPMLL